MTPTHKLTRVDGSNHPNVKSGDSFIGIPWFDTIQVGKSLYFTHGYEKTLRTSVVQEIVRVGDYYDIKTMNSRYTLEKL